MIILDTNVISEIIKKQPDEHVANWLRNQDTSNLATTAITVAELLAGICRMPEGKRRKVHRYDRQAGAYDIRGQNVRI